MTSGEIYYCESCQKFIRYENLCPDCGKAGNKIGWMIANEEM